MHWTLKRLVPREVTGLELRTFHRRQSSRASAIVIPQRPRTESRNDCNIRLLLDRTLVRTHTKFYMSER